MSRPPLVAGVAAAMLLALAGGGLMAHRAVTAAHAPALRAVATETPGPDSADIVHLPVPIPRPVPTAVAAVPIAASPAIGASADLDLPTPVRSRAAAQPAPAPAPAVAPALDWSGRGWASGHVFTARAAWQLLYSYDCAGTPGSAGLFQVTIAGDVNEIAISTSGAGGHGSGNRYGAGTFSFSVSTACSWHIWSVS